MTEIIAFFNSNFFVALTTIIAGSVAVYLYQKQKSDNKKDAAKTIYSEIVQAERVIQDLKRTVKDNDQAKQSKKLLEFDSGKFRLGDSGWSKLKYLFINDFDANEWEKLNTFFNQRDAFDKAMLDIGGLFPKNIEYRTKSIQEELAKLAVQQATQLEESIKPENEGENKDSAVEASQDKPNDEQMEIIKKYNDIAERFKSFYIDLYTPFQYQYNPIGTYTFLEKDLDHMDLSISISSIGQKLKKISK